MHMHMESKQLEPTQRGMSEWNRVGCVGLVVLAETNPFHAAAVACSKRARPGGVGVGGRGCREK